ncbi:hypothetical protein [Streptomyces erythrochromogenes]|uniref:hypothetical protein n=2 Tax=Streptomyces erythrochromogenes TaxID=285574 RepID=UPI003822D827
MSRTRVRPEDLFCARCHRTVRLGAAHWPEGYLCSACYDHALETYGQCVGCGVDRLTPGIAPHGGRWCTDCAGGLGEFHCERCGREARRYLLGVCGNCVLAERLEELLDDGAGRVRPELVPFFDEVRSAPRPKGCLTWVGKPHVQKILRALAHGEVPLTHEGLSTLSPWRSVAHVRDLLMHTGVLPHRDRHPLLFERRLPEWLDTIADAEHRQLLNRFATWHLLRKLRATAAKRPLGPGAVKTARTQLIQAAAFLVWLAERDRAVGECTQTDLDAWFAQDATARRVVQAFLRWSMDHQVMPRLKAPTIRTENPAPISQHHRIALIRKIMTSDDLPLMERIAAALILLYAQPVRRLVRLTVHDVQRDGDQVALLLGDPPTPVPEPFAELLFGYIRDGRPNRPGGTLPASDWLFPGRRAGQPVDPATLGKRLTAAGVPTLNGRTATLRQLVLQAPPSVVAGMLGYHTVHAEAVAAQAGGTWKKYAPGDHTR